MKKLLSLLLVCIFVLTMILSLSSCKWFRNRNNDDPTVDENPSVETPGESTGDGSGIYKAKVRLPAIKIPGLTPEAE